jgi:hypothetical protein
MGIIPMHRHPFTFCLLLFSVACGCARESDEHVAVAVSVDDLATSAAVPKDVAKSSAHPRKVPPGAHHYVNRVNHRSEGPIQVTSNSGRPATRFDWNAGADVPIENVEMKIVWTSPTDWKWNYVARNLFEGDGGLDEDLLAPNHFVERKLKAKSVLEIGIPETEYRIYVLDGRIVPYFYDGEKDVIWQLRGIEKEMERMRNVATAAKRITLAAVVGDGAEYFVFDFSDRDDAPRVQYVRESHGPSHIMRELLNASSNSFGTL